MSNELVVVNRLEGITFQNEYLAESVRKIIECSRNIIANHFQIAYELASIKKLELYKEDGYESVADFAEKVFGFSKTSTSLAIKVAERYLIDEGDQIATTFFDTGTDFSFNQLIETLPLSERRVNSLVFDKKLRPTMTVKQIRTLVQEEKKKGNNQSFDIETEENRGINLEIIDISASSSSSVQSDSSSEHELKDVIASSISSVQSGQELKEENRESISSSQGSMSLNSEKPQNAPESTSNYQETSQSLSTGLQSFSDSSSEQELKQEKNKDLEELIRGVPKELREYILMLEEENKKLREEIIRLTPVKRKRGRPRKVQD